MAARVGRDGLYEPARGGALPVLREGDTVDGRRVTGLVDHSASASGNLLSLATLDDGRAALLSKSKRAGWTRLVSDGDPNDRGDAITLAELPAFDARRGTVVAALSLTSPDRTLLHALRPGLPPELLFIVTPERTLFDEVGAPILVDDGLAFWGRRAGDDDGGIFLRRKSAVRALVAPGMRVRGGRLASITGLRAAGSSLLFEAALNETTSGLFAWRSGGRLRRVDRPGWPSRAWLVGGPRVFASVGSRREPDPPALYLLAPGGARRLAVAGDPSPLGGSLTLAAFGGDAGIDRPLALTRRGVAFLDGSTVLEARFPRRPTPR
jgi:hypothetical protein